MEERAVMRNSFTQQWQDIHVWRVSFSMHTGTPSCSCGGKDSCIIHHFAAAVGALSTLSTLI